MADRGDTSQIRWRGGAATLGVAAAGLLGALAAFLLFEQAVPQVRFKQTLTAASALTKARDFARQHDLPFPEARTAVRFAEEGSLQLFLELSTGAGKATLDSVAAGRDVALFRWTVRAFTPGDVHETRVRFAPDGRVTGFSRELSETDRRPALDSAAAESRARDVVTGWMSHGDVPWPLVSASREVVPASARVDWHFTYERADRRIAGAPIRLDVDLSGDVPSGAREYVVIPETFVRRYAEMRSSNELLAQVAAFGFPVYGLIALLALYRAQRDGRVRWRAAIAAAAVLAGLQAASMANDIPGSWYDYATASPPGAFLVQRALAALLVPLLFGAFLVVVLGGGETLTRAAFPAHLDWWSVWRARAHPRVARQVFAGYAVCAVGLGYVATFYYAARHLLGWWVPSALLDDPNAIASPLPFLSAIANAAQAGVLEEVLFRAVPLSAVALLTRGRSWHRAAMAVTVVVTAIVFGFAHASYASWPAYSRGVELFAEAVLWALIFLRVGLVPTVIGHFTFDLFLFGLFAMQGDAPAYRVSLAVVALVMCTPALIVLWARWRPRGAAPAWDALTFGAWQPPLDVESDGGLEAPTADGQAPVPAMPPVVDRIAPVRRRWDERPWLMAVAVAMLLVPRGVRLAEPRFSIDRARAIAIADSALRARGALLDGLTPMAEAVAVDDAESARYLAHIERPDLVEALARSYRPLSAWRVRFDRREGTAGEKAEGWRMQLLADGTPHDWQHVLPEDAARPDLARDEARLIARRAAAASGIDTVSLREQCVEEVQRPHRRDLVFVFDDRAVAIPGGASARVRVRVAGNDAVALWRSVRLLEQWSRADTARMERRGTIGMVAILLGLLAGIVIAIVAGRRPPRLQDRPLSRRALIVVGIAALLLMAASGVNALPRALASWDSATPWRSHVLTVTLGLVEQLVTVVLPASLWLMTDALRRRVGVPAVVASRESWRSGAALGALAFVTARLAAWAGALRGMPTGPETALGALWPSGSGALDVWRAVMVMPLAVALPALLVASLARRAWVRTAALAVATGGTWLLLTAWGGEEPWRAPVVSGAVLVASVVWWVAIARWGRDGVGAWVIGAAVAAGLNAADRLALAAHPGDRWSAVGGVVMAALMVTLAARLLRAPEGSASSA